MLKPESLIYFRLISINYYLIILLLLTTVTAIPPNAFAAVDCSSFAGTASCEENTDPGRTTSNHQPNVMNGNPINVITGNKYQAESDYAAYDSHLSFSRYYNSHFAAANLGLGNGWRMTYSTILRRLDDDTMVITQSDGRNIVFSREVSDGDISGLFKAVAPPDGSLTMNGNYYYWSIPDGRRLKFLGPLLVEITYTSGEVLSLRYRNDKLNSVTSSTGPELTFHYFDGEIGLPGFESSEDYQPAGHLSKITSNHGNTVSFGYDHNHNLIKTNYTREKETIYQYKDPLNRSLLTERIERREKNEIEAHSRWTYDDRGYASGYLNRLTGESREFSYVYSINEDQDGQTTIDISGGSQEIYYWKIDDKHQQTAILSRTVKACSDCTESRTEYIYDDNYQLTDVSDSFVRSKYTYDSLGRVIKVEKYENNTASPDRTNTFEYRGSSSDISKSSDIEHSTQQHRNIEVDYNQKQQIVEYTESDFSTDAEDHEANRRLTIERDDNGLYEMLSINGEVTVEITKRSETNRPVEVLIVRANDDSVKKYSVDHHPDDGYEVNTLRDDLGKRTEDNVSTRGIDQKKDNELFRLEERLKRYIEEKAVKDLLEFTDELSRGGLKQSRQVIITDQCTVYRPKKCDDLDDAKKYAFLAGCVYEPPSCAGNGWEIVNPESIGLKDKDFVLGAYKSVLVRNSESGEYVLSFAGTDDRVDVLEDILQANGIATPQYVQAVDLSRTIVNLLTGESLFFVGHSLGGGLASAAALHNGLPAIVYNSAGLHSQVIQDLNLSGSDANSIIDNYIVEGEIVTAVQDLDPITVPSLLPLAPLTGWLMTLDGPSAIGNRIPLPAIEDQPSIWTNILGNRVTLLEMIRRHKMTAVNQFIDDLYVYLGCGSATTN